MVKQLSHVFAICSMGMVRFTYMNGSKIYGIHVGKYSSPMGRIGVSEQLKTHRPIGSNHLLRKVKEPKYLSEEVIIHPIII